MAPGQEASARDRIETRIWDSATGAVLRIIPALLGRRVKALVVEPDGSWLASAGHSGEIRIWSWLGSG